MPRYTFQVPVVLIFEIEDDDRGAALESARKAVAYLDENNGPLKFPPSQLRDFAISTTGVQARDLVEEGPIEGVVR